METGMKEVKDSFCRGCHSYCPVQVDIVDGKTVALRPIKNHPVFHGYACAKGRASPEFAYLDGRLLHSVKRQPDGSLQQIASGKAIEEIATVLKQTIERHGPRSVALYIGTTSLMKITPLVFSEMFMAAIESPMVFSTGPLDQPGKFIAQALHGTWLAMHANLEQSDCWLAIGINPAISMFGPPNPAHAIKRAQKRGASIYVIDPRRSELAQQADLFLQARPGQDAIILAGLINIVLNENLQDQAFIDDNANGLDILRQAVAKFTPEFVAQRADISTDTLKEMARGYAKSKKGVVFAGTGPNMSPHGTLMEYLRLCLMTICGHWLREGDALPSPGVLVHPMPPLAQAVDPTPGWGLGETMRVRNLTKTACGMPTTALAEEILLEGEGQIKALISIGGNPMAAWPDQLRTQEAMKKLDLLVCVDPVMSDTAKYADYVIAPKVLYETMYTTVGSETGGAGPIYPFLNFLAPYGASSPPLVEPPPGSDVIDDWEFFYDLARHMGKKLTLKPFSFIYNPPEAEKRALKLDMNCKPTHEQVWDMLLADSPVPFNEVKANPATGKVYDLPEAKTMGKLPGWTGKLDIGNADMMKDLQRAYTGTAEEAAKEFTHRVISLRLKDRYNSDWRDHPVSTRLWPYNPAFMHPDDLAKWGIGDGDVIEIRSRRGAIKGVVKADKKMLPGVIAMAHCWGGNPEDDPDPVALGANTGVLTDNTVDYDPYSAMPRMSTIPVNIKLIERRIGNSTT